MQTVLCERGGLLSVSRDGTYPAWLPSTIEQHMLCDCNGRNVLDQMAHAGDGHEGVLSMFTSGDDDDDGDVYKWRCVPVPKLIVDVSAYGKKYLPSTAVSVQELCGKNVLLTQGTQHILEPTDVLANAWSATILKGPPNRTSIYWNRQLGMSTGETDWMGSQRLTTEGECRLAYWDGIVRQKVVDFCAPTTVDSLADLPRKDWYWNAAWLPQESYALPVLRMMSDEPVLFVGYAK